MLLTQNNNHQTTQFTNQDDCFVDASNELSDTCREGLSSLESGITAAQNANNDATATAETTWTDAGSGTELKVRLEETTVLLKMALNNEFVRALEICGRR